jgi:hypothetical protein
MLEDYIIDERIRYDVRAWKELGRFTPEVKEVVEKPTASLFIRMARLLSRSVPSVRTSA